MSRMPRSKALLGLGLIAACIATYWVWSWWTTTLYTEKTNNAYIRADITTVSAQVEGYVETVLVQDNQRVKQGDILVRIQPDTFRARTTQGEAELERALTAINMIATKLSLQESLIDQAEANLDAVVAAHDLAKSELGRAKGLVADNVASAQRYEGAVAAELKARAEVTGARAHLDGARQQLDVLAMERLTLDAEAREKAAALSLLEIELSYTEVRAPIDGVVGNKSARTGQFVRPGMHLLAIVPDSTPWIIANFKETQLTKMKPGQTATITVDSYPDIELIGKIESLAPASGAEFSLLPPENATGNFSKIVQRIPIKIVLDDVDSLEGKLRPGMSVVVDVDTRQNTRRSGSLASNSN